MCEADNSKRLFNPHCDEGVFNTGSRTRELIELLKSALDEYDIGKHHLLSGARTELAAKIFELTPGDLSCAVFGRGGGETIDLAFKVAGAFT